MALTLSLRLLLVQRYNDIAAKASATGSTPVISLAAVSSVVVTIASEIVRRPRIRRLHVPTAVAITQRATESAQPSRGLQRTVILGATMSGPYAERMSSPSSNCSRCLQGLSCNLPCHAYFMRCAVSSKTFHHPR